MIHLILASALTWCGLSLLVVACVARNRYEQPDIGTDDVVAARERLRLDAIETADFVLWEIETRQHA